MKIVRTDGMWISAGLPLALGTFAALMMASTSTEAEVSTLALTKTLQQRVCYEAFWWDRDSYRFGKTVPIVIRKEGNVTYVWSESLSVVPGASRWANFFTVMTNGKRTEVGSSYGYNLDVVQGTPDFEKKKSQVFSGTVENLPLRVPKDCTPHFIKDTPLKKRMLEVVESTLMKQLTLFSNQGAKHYPAHLRVLIANFNTDYPETQVLIPGTGEILYVTLQDSTDPLSNTFLQQGEYPIRLEYNPQAVVQMKDKIVTHGIAREIQIGGS